MTRRPRGRRERPARAAAGGGERGGPRCVRGKRNTGRGCNPAHRVQRTVSRAHPAPSLPLYVIGFAGPVKTPSARRLRKPRHVSPPSREPDGLIQRTPGRAGFALVSHLCRPFLRHHNKRLHSFYTCVWGWRPGFVRRLLACQGESVHNANKQKTEPVAARVNQRFPSLFPMGRGSFACVVLLALCFIALIESVPVRPAGGRLLQRRIAPRFASFPA